MSTNSRSIFLLDFLTNIFLAQHRVLSSKQHGLRSRHRSRTPRMFSIFILHSTRNKDKKKNIRNIRERHLDRNINRHECYSVFFQHSVKLKTDGMTLCRQARYSTIALRLGATGNSPVDRPINASAVRPLGRCDWPIDARLEISFVLPRRARVEKKSEERIFSPTCWRHCARDIRMRAQQGAVRGGILFRRCSSAKVF